MQFIRETNHLNVILAITALLSVHEGKKPFECDICDYSFSWKSNFIKHVASVHEGKKPLKRLIKNKIKYVVPLVSYNDWHTRLKLIKCSTVEVIGKDDPILAVGNR